MTSTSRPSVAPATDIPCLACPWRTANQGQPTPGGWYSRRNLDRLWSGLRRGARMSCHPTDARMADVVQDGYVGFTPAPDGARTRECAGATTLVQREFTVLQERYGADITAYRKARPKGLTRHGILALLERAVFGGSVLDPSAMTRPDLNNPDVGHAALTWPSRA